jgi:small subunit ribosomal protein S20
LYIRLDIEINRSYITISCAFQLQIWVRSSIGNIAPRTRGSNFGCGRRHTTGAPQDRKKLRRESVPVHKSAKKSVAQDEKANQRNRMYKSRIRTAKKKLEQALTEKAENVDELYRQYVSTVDRAVSSGVLHRNVAARKKNENGPSIATGAAIAEAARPAPTEKYRVHGFSGQREPTEKM